MKEMPKQFCKEMQEYVKENVVKEREKIKLIALALNNIRECKLLEDKTTYLFF